MGAARKVRLTWRCPDAPGTRMRVFASEARAKRFVFWRLPSGTDVAMEPIGCSAPGQLTQRARRRGGQEASPARGAVCTICGRWRPRDGRGHGVCDVRFEEEARSGRSLRLPDGDPSPASENAIRVLEDGE
jgi:hypothetical protein